MPPVVGRRKNFFSWLKAYLTPGQRRSATTREPDRTEKKINRNGGGSAPTAHKTAIPRRLRYARNTFVFPLAPVRRKLGDHWESYGPSVHRIADRLFAASLDGKATVKQYGDSYLITFKHLKGKRANTEGKRLYEQFMSLLYQNTDGDSPKSAKHHPAATEPDIPVRRQGLLRRLSGVFSRIFRKRRPDDVDHETASTASDTGQHGEEAASDESLQGNTADEGSGPRFVAAKTAISFVTAPHGAGPKTPSWRQARDSQKLIKRKQEARGLENAMMADVLRRKMEWSKETANRQFPPPDLSFIYRSMWNVKTGHITTYTAVPACWKNSMEVLHGEAIVPPPRRPENLFELDLLSLENSIEVLHECLDLESNVLLMNGVHASTLTDKSMLKEYVTIADTISKPARANLIFEIIDIGDYAFQAEAGQMVKLLSSFGRAVTASIGIDDRNFSFWNRCGLMAVGVDLSRATGSEEEIAGKLGYFVAQAKRNHMQSYLRELDKRSQAIYAESSGFDFLEGSVIGSDGDPKNLVLTEFSLENLYVQKDELVWTS